MLAGAHTRDSAATELPETWVSALHSTDSMDALSDAVESLEGPAEAPESSRPLAGSDNKGACSCAGSSVEAVPSVSAKQQKAVNSPAQVCCLKQLACQLVVMGMGTPALILSPMRFYLSFVTVWLLPHSCAVLC